MYEQLSSDPARAVAAVVGRTAIDLQVGDYVPGIERLEAIRSAGERSADWHAALAALLERVGRYDGAITHNRRALAIDADDLRSRWQLGRLYERLGRLKDAVKTYKPFEERMTGDRVDEEVEGAGVLPQRAEDLTWLGRGFYRYSVLVRHPALVQRTKHVLKWVYQEAMDYVDASYWPARLAAAELLLEKHNLTEAEEDFRVIRQQNERTPDAAVGLGRIALEHWDFEKAEGFVQAALEVNPRHAPARVLLADTRMTERRYAEAAAAARKVLETNPNHIEALSVLAAAQLRAGDRTGSEQTQARVRAMNPRPAALHFALGRWLSAGRQYVEAEGCLKKAIEFAPAWSEPRTELGLLYMETGDETDARHTLDASFALDGFNHRTFNVLDLLDRIERFAQRETEHFILKFDRERDGVVVPYFAEALEALYGDVCADFETSPKKKTIIELFPGHDAFSVRISGRPFIATVGACTGRVIAMQAPRGGPPFGRFNWAGVLRHEFTHTVTLAATENRIPHWMTEGLAVFEETAPRSWTWMRLLADAIRRDRLFTLQSIDWGFMRPRRPNDRTLAYAQSEWMVEFIIERFGYAAISGLLKAFHDGAPQARAFEDVLHVDTAAFDAAFKVWATRQVTRWGLPTDPVQSSAAIRAQIRKRPRNAALRGRLAEAELLDGDVDAAEAAARAGLDLDKDDPTALEVLSRILIGRMLAEKDESSRHDQMREAEPYIRRLNDTAPDNPTGIKLLGYVEQAWQQWPEAIALYKRYQRRFPQDPDPYRRLAGIHLHRKNMDAAVVVLEQLARLVEDEPAVPRQIAAIYVDQGKPDRAARWLRQAIRIDPYDADTHAGLGEASLATEDAATAEREFQAVCTLRPEDGRGYEGLARAYRAKGDEAKATELEARAAALGHGKSEEAGPKPR